jgi:hypothetical protein
MQELQCRQAVTKPNPYEAPGCQETDYLSERIFAVFSAFFPGKVSVRARGLTSFPSTGADEVCCTKHVLRFYRQHDGDCRATLSRPLRPRNILVPSYRPTQQGGCTCSVRQLASGSGERQHTSPLGDHRHMARSRSGWPINRRGLRGYGLCAPGRSLTQRDNHCRALSSGSPRARPVRRQARPLRSRCLEKLVHIEGLLAF